MRQSDSPTTSSRLDDVATLGKAVIKEPVREAVQEALEEQRKQTQTETPTITETDSETSQGMSMRRRLLALTAGLATVTLLLRRRKQLLAKTPLGDQSSEETSGHGTDTRGGERTAPGTTPTSPGGATDETSESDVDPGDETPINR